MESEMQDNIHQQMQETRDSLTEKLETLEQKVVGTVENAASTVNETVDAIKDTVHETVAAVQGGMKDSVATVKDLFDVPAHVQRRPWLMVGGAVAVGYCLGAVIARNPPSQPSPVPVPESGNGAAARFPTVAAPATPAPPQPGVWAPEIAKLKGLALGMLFGTVRELLASSLPEHVGEQIKDVVDNVTTKMGGEPLPSSEWAKLTEMASAQGEQAGEPAAAPQQPKTEAGNGHPAVRRW